MEKDEEGQSVIARAACVTPTPQQRAWQEMEFTAFAHFGMNTFTDREWGLGTEDPRLFNPAALDAEQWVRVCREAGIKMIILTAKHHDGFCLWPSRYTEHSVKNSPWRGGQGDVVRELAEACRAGGLKLGLYLSPWDRHEPSYGDSPVYNAYFKNQLRELLTQYGEITEVWFDGACGEGPNGKRQIYDWPGYYAVIRELQPNALIAICGPDVRWVGNENGLAGETEWSVVGLDSDPERGLIDWKALHQVAEASSQAVKTGGGGELGSRAWLARSAYLHWYPAECDVSIRPGWFYHAHEDDKVKSLGALLDIYYKSVGRNAVLLLNLPPDRRGLIHENDVQRLRELRQALDATFACDLAQGGVATASNVCGNSSAYGPDKALDGDPATCWRADDNSPSAWLEVNLGAPVSFNQALLQEQITVGQRVEAYTLEAWDGRAWHALARGTTIGYKKLERFPEITAQKVRLVIHAARLGPTIQRLSLYQAPDVV